MKTISKTAVQNRLSSLSIAHTLASTQDWHKAQDAKILDAEVEATIPECCREAFSAFAYLYGDGDFTNPPRESGPCESDCRPAPTIKQLWKEASGMARLLRQGIVGPHPKEMEFASVPF